MAKFNWDDTKKAIIDFNPDTIQISDTYNTVKLDKLQLGTVTEIALGPIKPSRLDKNNCLEFQQVRGGKRRFWIHELRCDIEALHSVLYRGEYTVWKLTKPHTFNIGYIETFPTEQGRLVKLEYHNGTQSWLVRIGKQNWSYLRGENGDPDCAMLPLAGVIAYWIDGAWELLNNHAGKYHYFDENGDVHTEYYNPKDIT